MKLLSICIPTYNRADLVCGLLKEILQNRGAFEVCVHDDGSTDDTYSKLHAFNDDRLKISFGKNKGRAAALASAVELAEGSFIMLFDDDDSLTCHGLTQVLSDCASELPSNCAGYIYHLADQSGEMVGNAFPCPRANFLSLRADDRVFGDKKEVVRADILRSAVDHFRLNYRRVPTSLYWTYIALKYDVFCRNLLIGEKVYISGGMSSQVARLKRENAYPMFRLKYHQVEGFIRKRYKSKRFALKALLSLVVYSLLTIRFSIIYRSL